MRSITLIIPVAFVAHTHANELVASNSHNTDMVADRLINKLVDKLFNRVFDASPPLRGDVDNTTLGKPSQVTLGRPGQVMVRGGANSPPPLSCPRPLNSLPTFRDTTPTLVSYWPVPQTRSTMVFSATSPADTGTATEQKKKFRPGEKKGFVEEMRFVAMKLHTKDQAPKEGGKEAPKNRPKFAPSREGYLSFLVESKVVYDALESLMAAASHPSYAKFQNTGLERSAALEKDIADLSKEYSLEVPVPASDGPGRIYADLLSKLAVDDPPAFMCHFYNVYFAHSAGGRMIGKMVSDSVLDGKQLGFYEYGGADLDDNKAKMKELLEKVKENINAGAEEWSRDEKDHCLEETEKSFKYSGALLRCIMPGSH